MKIFCTLVLIYSFFSFALLVNMPSMVFINPIQKIVDKYVNKPIKIYCNSKDTSKLGYNDCNMLTNGENRIIQSFIKKGDTVLDVGANIGNWTKAVLNATEFQCIIYALEPIPATYKYLLDNLENQLHKTVFCYNIALGKESVAVEMQYFESASTLSSLFDRVILQNIPHQKIKVVMTSLDKFAYEQNISHINFLKIDTEGAELEVLLGAKRFIELHNIDIIQFEYGGTYKDAHISLLDVYNYLIANQYVIFRIAPNALIYISEWDEGLENFRYSNYLALKKVKN